MIFGSSICLVSVDMLYLQQFPLVFTLRHLLYTCLWKVSCISRELEEYTFTITFKMFKSLKTINQYW